MLENLNKKQKIIFFIIIGIMILFIIYYIYNNLITNSDYSYIDTLNDTDNSIISENLENTEKDLFITIYICGAVKENKVISLPINSRIIDAVEYVGGFSEDANTNVINLASPLEDGERIYIPSKSETSNVENFSHSSKNSKININTASQTELETIPGIGASTALKIINHRQNNGNFRSIEDIKEVSGIGDTKFENMKDYICVK